ncbi:MAG: hypothetical protein Q4E67_05060 [Planctomycetia bacterium]|nr:hypothetical protein [Planctomycetia bacterium]
MTPEKDYKTKKKDVNERKRGKNIKKISCPVLTIGAMWFTIKVSYRFLKEEIFNDLP